MHMHLLAGRNTVAPVMGREHYCVIVRERGLATWIATATCGRRVVETSARRRRVEFGYVNWRGSRADARQKQESSSVHHTPTDPTMNAMNEQKLILVV